IDLEAILVIKDEDLKSYLPAYGDRVALMAFARVLKNKRRMLSQALGQYQELLQQETLECAELHRATDMSTGASATMQIETQMSIDAPAATQIQTQRSTDAPATTVIGTQRSTDAPATTQIGTQRSTDAPATTQIGTQRSTDVQATTQNVTHTPADISTTTVSAIVEEQELQPDTGSPDLEITFHPLHISRDSTKSKEEILLELNSVVDRSRKKNMVNVTRENVIEGAIRAFLRRSFDPCADLHVKFGGEDGIDDGRLTREFMRLLKKEMRQQPIFVGKDGFKMLALHAPYCCINDFKRVFRGSRTSREHNTRFWKWISGWETRQERSAPGGTVQIPNEGTLPALLSFLTGLDEIPPLGFEYEGSISFRHSAELS
ncbi:hypothetical protein MAR_001798, partial [Mya arenaria]